MAILSLHKVSTTVGTTVTTHYFLSRPASYTGLTTETGIDEAAANEQDNPPIDIKHLLRKGILVRLAVRYTKAGKRRTSQILVARGKLGTAFDDLVNKSFNGSTIDTVSAPTRAKFVA